MEVAKLAKPGSTDSRQGIDDFSVGNRCRPAGEMSDHGIPDEP
jgi:hypothetical protein